MTGITYAYRYRHWSLSGVLAFATPVDAENRACGGAGATGAGMASGFTGVEATWKKQLKCELGDMSMPESQVTHGKKSSTQPKWLPHTNGYMMMHVCMYVFR